MKLTKGVQYFDLENDWNIGDSVGAIAGEREALLKRNLIITDIKETKIYEKLIHGNR